MRLGEIGVLFGALEINETNGVPQFQFEKRGIDNYFTIPDGAFVLSLYGEDCRFAKIKPDEMLKMAKKKTNLHEFFTFTTVNKLVPDLHLKPKSKV